MKQATECKVITKLNEGDLELMREVLIAFALADHLVDMIRHSDLIQSKHQFNLVIFCFVKTEYYIYKYYM